MNTIRDGRPDDHPALAELWRAAWQLTYPDIDFETRLPFILDQFAQVGTGRFRLRVAVHKGAPAGFTLVEIASNLLEQLAVDPAHWGSGIASDLIAEAKAATERPLTLVVNQLNHRALRFYRREGFRISAEGVNAASGKPTYTMVWCQGA